MILNVPNMITLFRLLLIPFLAVLLHFIGKAQGLSNLEAERFFGFWTMIVFAIAGFSDLVDGYYARCYGQVSVFGKFIDPMADKLIHLTALVFLVFLNRLSPWLVVILLSREIFINGLRTIAIAQGIVIDAARLGKAKTAWLNVGIGGLIWYHPVFMNTAFKFDPKVVGMIGVWVGLVLSVVSGMQYTFKFVRGLKD